MKILFTRFPLESAYGGAEFQTLSLMRGLLKHGHAVAFLGSCPVLLALCKKENIPAAELAIGPPPVTKWGTISFAWRREGMKAALQAALPQFHDLDVVCMLSLSEKLLLTSSADAKGIKVVWIEHDRIGRWLTKNPWLNYLLQAAKRATTVAVSSLTKAQYLQIGWPEDRVVDIVNGFDALRLGEGPRTNTGTPFHVGCVARLSKDKGVDLLLEAVRELQEIDVTIVGTGAEERTIHALATQLNRSAGRTRIHIEPKKESIGDFYRSIDALVLPSPEQDPCPLAPMEALSLGTPVILTDACGTAGYLKDGTDALIVKAGSIPALTEAILSMTNPQLRTRLAEAGQVNAKAQFSLDRMVDAYVQLFSKTT